MNKKNEIGLLGESVACNYIAELGYTILDRNYRCRGGEIDIIAADGNVTVFIEVKTRSYRSDGKFGSAKDAVTVSKQIKFTEAAGNYLKIHPECTKCRIDVIEVYLNSGNPVINHIKSCRFAKKRF